MRDVSRSRLGEMSACEGMYHFDQVLGNVLVVVHFPERFGALLVDNEHVFGNDRFGEVTESI